MALGSDVREMITSLLEEGLLDAHRRMLVVSGESAWCQLQGASIIERVEALWSEKGNLPSARPLIISRPGCLGEDVIPAPKAVHYLGTETQLVVYNCFDGLSPDALASVSGTLVAGGLLVLLTPSIENWHRFPDPDYKRMTVFPYEPQSIAGNFVSHLVDSLKNDSSISFWDQHAGITKGARNIAAVESVPLSGLLDNCLTQDQSDAVVATEKVLNGHRRRPTVITADRGRGKSSALGIAAARILAQQGKREILVTAPRFSAVETLFSMAERLLPQSVREGHQLQTAGGRLRFMPVDEILSQSPQAHLLLVDEAAAIPISLLNRVLARYARIVFSTTVHGYEGTGRGFQLRFNKLLNKQTPGWRGIKLSQPIRWNEGDPLERWVFDALLLDAEIADPEALDVSRLDNCQIESVSAAQLREKPGLLRQVFALLVQAHYQTSPSDLRDLLDGLNLKLWVMQLNNQVVAVTLIAEEGGFDELMSEAVWSGSRRPRGHLLPQILCSQSGWIGAASHLYWRVVRIAVHPSFQEQGIGSRMLKQLTQVASDQDVDFLASSFAASPELLKFWKQNGFQCLRVGMSRDTSSGAHSVILSRSLNDRAQTFQLKIQSRFHSHWIQQLSVQLSDMEQDLIVELLKDAEAIEERSLDEQDQLDLVAYGFGQRGYAQVQPVLIKLLVNVLSGAIPGKSYSDIQINSIIAKVLQNRSWKHCCELAGVAGQRQLEQQLRNFVKERVVTLELTDSVKQLISKIS